LDNEFTNSITYGNAFRFVDPEFIAAGNPFEGLLQQAGGNEFRVNESKCVAVGDAVCEFIIQKDPIS